MKREVVTLAGLHTIKLKFGKNICEKLKEIDKEKVNIEIRAIFDSKDDKIFKLVSDYIHLMNRKVCERNQNNNSCILCETILQECEIKNGKKKLTLLLSKSEDLDILLSKQVESQEENNSNSSYYYYVNWNIKDNQKHYELVGLLSQSIISEFIFPTSIFQYSNSRILITLSSSKTEKLLWSSNTLLMNNFIKYKNQENHENNSQDTLIFLKTIQNDDNLYIYHDSKNRIFNKNHINCQNIKKFQIKEIIERSIKLHRIISKFRRHLEDFHSLKYKYLNQIQSIIKDKDDYPNEIFNNFQTKTIQQHYSSHIYSKKQEKIHQQEKIKNFIQNFQNKHIELNELIYQNQNEIQININKIEQINTEIHLYRNDLINKISFCIYPITIEKKTSNIKIRNILLPLINVIQNLDNKQDMEISTSLGFSLHFLNIITKILELPSSNKILVKGSFSSINNNPLYFYPNMNKKQINKALKFYKSIIYNILNYFNINHTKSRNILLSNNILLMLLTITNYIRNYNN